jgi:hypothetical protein
VVGRCDVVASSGVAGCHGRKTQSHALVQHADIMVEGIICGGLDLELVAGSGDCYLCELVQEHIGYLQRLRLVFRAASIALHPPYEQQVLHYLMLQPIFSRRIP